MNDEQYEELLHKVERIDRRIAVLGDVILSFGSFVVAWAAYDIVKTKLEFGDGIASGAGFVAWCAFWMTVGYRFDRFDK